MRKIKEILSAAGRFWQRGRISLIIAAALVVAIVFVGLHDVGIILGYIAATLIMVEVTRRWRRIRNFIVLFFSSFFGMILLAFLHEEVVAPLIGLVTGAAAQENLGFRIFSDAVSLVILFFGPVGLFIGFIGTVALSVWRLAALVKRRKASGGA